MKSKLTSKKGEIPKSLTQEEEAVLMECIQLPGWQFESIIRPHCVFIQEPIIDGYYTKTEGGNPPTYKSVYIYGLIGDDEMTEGKGIVNYFVRKDTLLYQVNEIQGALDLVDLMRKDYKRLRYLDEKDKQKVVKKTA